MTAPRRVQLSRRRGARLPANTTSVARPTRWGNPYEIRAALPGWIIERDNHVHAHVGHIDEARATAVELYRQSLTPAQHDEIRTELAGRNLACWCPPDAPCHADVLLEIANP